METCNSYGDLFAVNGFSVGFGPDAAKDGIFSCPSILPGDVSISYGDGWHEEHYENWSVIVERMSTAIVRVYTNEGFVIGGDGLRCHLDGTQKSVNQKKVFHVKSARGCLALGTTGFGADDFEFSDKAIAAAEQLLTKSIDGLDDWVRRLARMVYVDFCQYVGPDVAKLPKPDPDPDYDSDDNGAVSRLLFAGYYGHRPHLAEVRFFVESGEIKMKRFCAEMGSNSTAVRVSGAPKLYDALVGTDDPVLSPYRGEFVERLRRHHGLTLADGIALTENYLRACSDPNALVIDGKCAKIGGHAHIAVITRDSGFRWHREPKPQSP